MKNPRVSAGYSSLTAKLAAREPDAVGFADRQFRGWLICAWAAANRAIGTRKGEQLT